MILDTNALSAFADGDRTLLSVIEREAALAVPVIVLGEYLFGIRQSRFRARYEQWLDVNLPLFDLLSIHADTASFYAEVRCELTRAGRPIPTNDVWIAALARQHKLAIVSRDRHFDGITGLRAVAW